jgi:glycosyltransferase involved in cell wall biosynthesis
MEKSAVVIVPTTGAPDLACCLESVLSQTYPATRVYLVCDGPQFLPSVEATLRRFDAARIRLLVLPENVGAKGFYGHRIYAAATHLVSEDYVLYLDQDNWFERGHVASMIELIETRGLQWAHSFRNICGKGGQFLVHDRCESLGRLTAWTGVHHVDTNAYCLRREIAVSVANAWHGGWGQDRVFYKALDSHFPKYDCTGAYSVNYRLGGNPGAVTLEFFMRGNAAIAAGRIAQSSSLP